MKIAASRTVRTIGPCTEVSFHCCIPSVGSFGIAAVGRLQPVASGVARGDSHRAAAVGAGRDRHDAARDRGRSAARRAAGRALEIPRIAGRAEQQILGECGVAELGRVGLADHDRAGRLQPRDLDRIGRGDVVLERLRPVAVDEADRVLEVLDAERQPGKRADLLAARDLLVERTRLFHRGVSAQRDKRVELRSWSARFA